MRLLVGAVAFAAVLTFPPWTLADHEPFVGASPAMLKISCVEPSKGDHRLRTVYKEAPIKRGYTEDGAVMQLYSSENGETWTITILTLTGFECVIMAGEKLKDVPFKLGVSPGQKT